MENKKFELCYVCGNKAWFTSNWEKQWGDDWDDAPYECNAGDPYQDFINANGELCKIELKTLYFEFPFEWIKLPCDGHFNSPFSVEDINRGDIAWIRGENFNIQAKTTFEDFIKIVEKNNGRVYLLKENTKNSCED